MHVTRAKGPTRRLRRGRSAQRGAASQRLVLALAASALLTIAVSLPMAYQAREARQQEAPASGPEVEVLGTSTVPLNAPRSDALHWKVDDFQPLPLAGAEVPDRAQLLLIEGEVVRVDFTLDDGPVQTVRHAPFEVPGDVSGVLSPGAHTLTATVRYDDGHVEVQQASFAVPG